MNHTEKKANPNPNLNLQNDTNKNNIDIHTVEVTFAARFWKSVARRYQVNPNLQDVA